MLCSETSSCIQPQQRPHGVTGPFCSAVDVGPSVCLAVVMNLPDPSHARQRLKVKIELGCGTQAVRFLKCGRCNMCGNGFRLAFIDQLSCTVKQMFGSLAG